MWRVFDFIFSKLGVAVMLLIVAVLFLGSCAVYKSSEKTVTFRVEDKERVTSCSNGDCSSYYLIFTDQGVYKNEDDLVYGKFRSSDLYAKLKRNQTFTCKVAGWRVGFMSMYPNIINCEGRNSG